MTHRVVYGPNKGARTQAPTATMSDVSDDDFGTSPLCYARSWELLNMDEGARIAS